MSEQQPLQPLSVEPENPAGLAPEVTYQAPSWQEALLGAIEEVGSDGELGEQGGYVY